MKNRTIIFMFSAAVAVMLMLVAPAGAQTCQDCSPSELEIGTCTTLTYLDASPSGYVLRLLPGYPLFDGANTISKYEVCLMGGYNPHALSHADLEFKICNATGCSAVAATANGSSTGYTQIAAGTGGDPSSGYGDDFPSDLVKIDLPSGFQNGTFSVTVGGRAYATLGNIGFKAGQDIYAGYVLLPVCSGSCPLVKFSAFSKTIVETESGYKFDLTCNDSTGCCEATRCWKPDAVTGIWDWTDCTPVALGDFFGISKDGEGYSLENISSDGACLNLVVDDTSISSPSYCSGGWCWY